MAGRALRGIVTLYRDAFGGLPRITWLLCVAAFIIRCGSMVVPFLGPYLKKDFAMTATHAGFVIGLYGAGAILGSWIGGRLTDRIGPVRLQVLAFSGSAVWMLLMTQLDTAALLVPGVFVLGLLNDAFRPGSNTAAVLSCPVGLRRKALALNRFALNLGWAIGPTIGGYLVRADFRWMFVANGVTCGLAALWLWRALRGWNPLPPPPPAGSAPGGRPLRDRRFVWLMGANVCVLLAFMQYFTTGSRVFVDQGHSETSIGWLLAINPVLITLFEMPIVHMLRGQRALPIVATGSLLVGLGYLCMLLPFGVGAIVMALAVVTFGEVLQMPMLGAWVNDHAPDHARGAYNGAYGMTFTLALVLAPILGGVVYDRGGAPALWWSCCALGVAGCAMFAAARR